MYRLFGTAKSTPDDTGEQSAITPEMIQKVVHIFALVGESIAEATHALLAGDRELAKRVVEQDVVIDTLVNELVAYKARLIADGFLRTLFIMGLVLFGSSLVAFAVAPAVIWVVQVLRRTSRSHAGGLGEVAFLTALGMGVFWLYYRNYVLGTAAIVPPFWRNGPHL